MIRTLYLCDSSVCKCGKDSCAALGKGYCQHTSFREYSKNWKNAEPSAVELTWYFEAIQDDLGFTYWEKEKANERRRSNRGFKHGAGLYL